MAGSVRVVLKSVWNDKGIKAAERSLQSVSKGITNTFKGIGIAAAAGAAAIAKLSADSIRAASDLQESTNAVNVAFGDAADAILKIGETSAQSLGVARTEFNQAAVRFSAFAERVVGQGGDVAGFIGDITTRAADFASVFNIDVAEALQVFQSGLSGEAEPLKRFGINLLDSEVKAYAMANGIGEVGKELTETEKVQARYGLLLQSTNKTAGDFANTSESLANRQRILEASFTDIQAEIGQALLPSFEKLVGIAKDDLLPVFKDIAEKIGPAVADFLEFLAEVFEQAFTEGTDLNEALNDLGDAFDLLFGAITGGKRDAEGFADFLSDLIGIIEWLVTTLASLIAGFKGIGYAFEAAKRGDWGEVWRFLTSDTIAFVESLEPVKTELDNVGQEGVTAYGHLATLNNITLDSLRRELIATADESRKLFSATSFTGTGGTASWLAAMGFGGMGEASTEAEKKSSGAAAESAFSKVQRFIKDSQKSLANAQKTYNAAIRAAKDNYVESVLRTEEQFAEKLAGIVQQSQNRLRNAFASAVRVSLTDIFTVEETSSVENLVRGLQERLSKSRNLLSKAAELNAAGFSQTFIEQVVEAGVETGNELAGAILAASPETQAELQNLFSEIEDTADTGMDSLAQEIYDKAGLATRELRDLYADTQQELVDTLLELKKDLDASIVDANQSFVDSIKDIREQLKENIAGMKGDLGGLEGTLEQFYNKLNKLQGKAEVDTSVKKPDEEPSKKEDVSVKETGTSVTDLLTVAASSVSDAVGIFVDQTSDLDKVILYLAERINAAQRFAANIGDPVQAESARMFAIGLAGQIQSLQGLYGQPIEGRTVININVKTDSTQSVAMVGKTLGNTINKYVTAGGQILVSPT